MPFGGFDPQSKHLSDDAWDNLKTLTEFLEDGEPVPPDLASWLVQAIKHAGDNPDELLRRLGLKRGRGRKHHRHDADAWLEWGRRVHVREARDEAPEAALVAVMAEYQVATGVEVERSQLQSWHDKYREGLAEGRRQ